MNILNKICLDKKCYDKKGAISAINKRKKEGVDNLRCYHCTFCNGWHLSHKKHY